MKSAAYFFQIKAKIIVKTSDETQRNENNSLKSYVVSSSNFCRTGKEKVYFSKEWFKLN